MSNRLPTPNVTAAANVPSRSWRVPEKIQLRLVNCAVSAPAPNSAASDSTAEMTSEVAPTKYGSNGMIAPTVNDANDEPAAVQGLGNSVGFDPELSHCVDR